jgi:predicted dithiol-disulfide oxidoreductase (DUF899 family)
VNLPQIVPEAEWEAAREALLEKEKAVTKERDSLAAKRRRLPMVAVEKEYAFEGPGGEASLLDLFGGRRQLIVYRFFYEPGVSGWPERGCGGCSMFVDNVGHFALPHLRARDTSLVLVSPAPQENIQRLRKRMEWTIPWFTTSDDFSEDFGVDQYFGINVFIRDEDQVFRTYFMGGRGAETIGSVWSFLDLTPFGRQEEWEDSPEGRPQSPPYEWWRLHDEYGDEAA